MNEKKVREAIKEFEVEKQTYEDAISYCKHFEPKNDCGRYEEKIAICKTAIEALEKQLPKKPDEDECTEKTHYKCPACGRIPLTVYADGYRLGTMPKYCEGCGQKLDWSEMEE